ncbi:MAG: hypothetical protein F6K47_42725, partial [Symploca sp. SIO2E6]|nr:hypothetical protein [Symploca sp. SIO2E6]
FTNFIIVKIAKAARKVAGKLKGLAKSLMKRFKGKKGKKGKKNKDKKEKDKNSQNQEKLDRAVRELQPKIGAMLRRGASSMHLRAKLAMWRVKYRLKKLSLEKQGANDFQVVAQVNPKANVLKGFTPTDRQTLRIVHKIGKEMLNHPEAEKAAQRLAEQRTQGAGKERANPLVTESGVGNLGAIKDLRNNVRERKHRESEYFQVGNDHVTSEWHPNKSISEGTNLVRLSHKGAKYPDIKKHLDIIHGDLADNPRWQNVSEQRREGLIAIAIWNMARGKKVPASLTKYTKHFAQLNRLIFHVEGSRDDAATVFPPMLVEMIGKREMNFEEAFNAQGEKYDKRHGGGGLFPPSQQGAVAAMDRVNEDSQSTDQDIKDNNINKNPPRKAKEQARRQIKFIERWIHMKMKEQNLNFKDKATFEKFVKEEFEKELRKSMNKFFGLSSA